MGCIPIPFGYTPQYRSQNVSRALSANVWRKYGHALQDTTGQKIILAESFTDFGQDYILPTVNTALSYAGNGQAFYDTSCTMLKSTTAGETGGVIKTVTVGTTGKSCNWVGGGAAASMGGDFQFTASSPDSILIFEARVRVPVISVAQTHFIGLIDPAGCLADGTHILSSNDLEATTGKVGFTMLNLATGIYSLRYVKASGTAANLVASCATAVAATWTKLGFVYDPNEDSSHQVRVFQDNVEYTTAYGIATTLALSSFPSAKLMIPAFSNASAASSVGNLDVDWIACAQVTR